MQFSLTPIGPLPASFAALRDASERDEYNFVRRLEERWDGVRYEDDALATLWGAQANGELIAIGAQTYDEYDPSPLHRRIRHFYVREDWRRCGVGRAVAQRLIADAFALAPRVHLRATYARSIAFWDSVGFSRVDRLDRTHELLRPDG